MHDGSFGNACKLIEAAAAAGADAVKFQTHIAEAETLPNAPSPGYFSAEPRMDYFRRTGFDPDQWRKLKAACEKQGVTFLSSPFSLEAVDLLEDVGVGSYKVASGEVSNLPLLEKLAGTGKPVLLSSGMSDWAELDRAVEALRPGGPLTVMQCTSAYPCPPERAGLNLLAEMRARYGLPVGFSDHSDGLTTAIAAAALGATVIEKHFTFSRLMYGSDAANATEPDDFARLAPLAARDRGHACQPRRQGRPGALPRDEADLREVGGHRPRAGKPAGPWKPAISLSRNPATASRRRTTASCSVASCVTTCQPTIN